MLLKRNGTVHLGNTDLILTSLFDQTMTTVCVDASVYSDNTHRSEVLSHIFIGPDFPDTTTIHAYTLPDIGVSVFVGPL